MQFLWLRFADLHLRTKSCHPQRWWRYIVKVKTLHRSAQPGLVALSVAKSFISHTYAADRRKSFICNT